MNTLWRLAWALPLVLAVGALAMLMLKRVVAPAQPAAGRTPRMSKRESLPLSDDTHVHLIEVDGKGYLIVESARQTVLQAQLPQASEAVRLPTRLGPQWLRQLSKSV